MQDYLPRDDGDDDQQPTVEFAALSFPASDPPATNEPARRPPVHHDAMEHAAAVAQHVDTTISVDLGDGTLTELDHGHVVIAAITSCTNTSNPSVMLAAGLLARNAVARGLTLEAVGQDVAGARLEGRHGVPRARRA